MKLSRKKEFYVYALLDPRKPGKHRYGRWVFPYEPFYVGKGKGKRAFTHLRGDNYNTAKNNIIKEVQSEGLDVVVSIKRDGLTERQAFELEKSLIARIGRSDLKLGCLCNLTDGGDGFARATLDLNDEKRKARSHKIAEAKRKYWASISKEEKSERARKAANALWKNMSDADRKRFSKTRSKHMTNAWNTSTDKEKDARRKQLRKSYLGYVSNRSEEETSVVYAKIVQSKLNRSKSNAKTQRK